MRKFGLIGFPLGHSFSKKYFTEKFEREGLSDCLYENYPLENIDLLPDILNSEPDLRGFNVTIPHKSSVIRFLTHIADDASEIGAVNVVKIKRSGSKTDLYGFNSDIKGISDSLAPYLTASIKQVLILGTGGSSRAVSYVMRKAGLKVMLVSRNAGKGTVGYDDLTAGIIRESGIIVNTTPLGMFPDVGSCPDLDYNLLTGEQVLFDLVYNPEMTRFLRMGAERGCTVISGIRMLYSQADRAWEIWNDNTL
ncbi:MAG TPA: shikimate dehydrogenase [Bacteroidales bacterium]|nr:shikimate dehydrogenase [Bacteroidales bacterium]